MGRRWEEIDVSVDHDRTMGVLWFFLIFFACILIALPIAWHFHPEIFAPEKIPTKTVGHKIPKEPRE